MLTTGHTLVRIELLNWGNFDGLHTVNLYSQNAGGPLFAPPPSSAILGVNGSGKSTIIDGIMISLLPFETILKLGVTNDYEKGSGGGRRVEDYVLGKFASTGGHEAKDLSMVYNRQNGLSIFQLTFKHNERSESFLTVGTAWWYNNYKVGNRLFYTSQSDIKIKDICLEDQLPKNAKVFKEIFQTKGMNPQCFDTAQSYFTILSALLGGVTRDDLKLFNRAFYVKSIENIDYFIRDNMLIEEENKNLGALLENVANGNHITQQIDLCRKKLEGTFKILDTLHHLSELQGKILEEARQKSFVQLFQYWLPVCLGKEKLTESEKKLVHSLVQIPLLQKEENSITIQINVLEDQLRNSETARNLEMLEGQIGLIKEKLSIFRSQNEIFKALMTLAEIKNSANQDSASKLLLIKDRISELTEKISKGNNDLISERNEEHLLQNSSIRIRDELKHLESHKTLIPKPLYEIKVNAIKELKLPEYSLMFVGETIAIKESLSRLAVEAALEPISRNLLVHPDYLDKFTSWLDKTKLNFSLTVKRIAHEEILLHEELDQENRQGILSMIALRDQRENPFKSYVAKWLNSNFAYNLVSVGEFKRGTGLLVTEEGLVKRDRTTMRKLKRDFTYSLGWNPAQRIEELAAKLISLNHSWSACKQRITDLENKMDVQKNLIHSLQSYKTLEVMEFLNFPSLEKNVQELELRKDALLKKDKDLVRMDTEVKDLKAKRETVMMDLAAFKAQERELKKEAEQIRLQLPLLEDVLKRTRHFTEALAIFGGEEMIEEALLKARNKFELNQHKILDEIDQRLQALAKNKESYIGKIGSLLTQYQREFGDPNLSYLFDMEKVSALMNGWSQHKEKLEKSELADLQEKWKEFFNDILINSIRDTLDEIKGQLRKIQENLISINKVLKMNHFEKLPDEERYLQIDHSWSQNDSIRRFRKESTEIEKIFSSPELRIKLEEASSEVIKPLKDFVDYLKDDARERTFVTDVRNHFLFKVHSWARRIHPQSDELMETFMGARHDAKSSAQTTQLAYTLLASSLAYRFHFNDPVKGKDTPRMIILDEFGGKFDNEKPRDILRMLGHMGFQSILVSPMTKAEILADDLSYVSLVHKASAKKSKVQSFQIQSKEDYNKIVRELSTSGIAPA